MRESTEAPQGRVTRTISLPAPVLPHIDKAVMQSDHKTFSAFAAAAIVKAAEKQLGVKLGTP